METHFFKQTNLSTSKH
jgi:hypothetical protein